MAGANGLSRWGHRESRWLGILVSVDSRYLRAFVAVAELGGISAAAEHLGYAQSTLSAQVQRLERDLERPVLNRTAAGTSLTEAGERLLPYARQALDLDDRLRRAVRAGRPLLRIGALDTLAASWVPDILAALDFGAGGPGTEADLTLTVGNRDRLTDGLRSGVLDMIFLFDNGMPLAGPHAAVGEDQTLLVAAPEHPLARVTRVSVGQLLHTEFLVAEPGCTTAMLVDRFGRDLTGRTPVSMVTGSLSALVRLLSHARGVALLPALTAAPYLESGELVALDLPAGLATVQIQAQWRTGLGPADQVIKAVLRLARRHAPVPEPARRTA